MRPNPYREILEAAKWVQHNIQLVRWNPDEFEKLFGSRSARDVLTSRKTSHLNPCLDLTMAYVHLLKEKGYPSRLVVEERVSARTKQPTLHFAVEIPFGKKWVTMDFVDGVRAQYYEGTYNPQKSSASRKSLGVHRYSTARLGYKSSLNTLLGLRGTPTLYKKFPHVTPRAAHAVFAKMWKTDVPRFFTQMARKPKSLRRK